MGLVIEPSVTCDRCDKRIRPNDKIVNICSGTLVRVETPDFESPYPEVNEDPEADFYYCEECAVDMLSSDDTDTEEPIDVARYWPYAWVGL